VHIPDGYLSPATCVAAYVATLPFWYVAFRRIQRLLHTRMVPLLAVFSAFSFVIMMFNLPLPGGTTGHAVGVGIATLVLGPWASIVAISIALLIQAVFFGDGGITAFGANCLNMAVVGSFVAYGCNLLIAGRSQDPKRRVFAAAISGYVAINAAAFIAAIEFGVQPLWFHDAAGTPLYAPYPLAVAIPAMMIGHLTFAGFAEALITGGLVAYLLRSSPDLLAFSMPRNEAATSVTTSAWHRTRKLWYGLAGLMILSPLGLLAAGTAWGEWGAADFADPAVRQEILVASGNVAPPEAAPQGLERLASVWTAPIPDYAPGFMHSEQFGYILSAMLGTGLILLTFLLVSRLFPKTRSA
jgi:cobalt/nickel transport system permease protein